MKPVTFKTSLSEFIHANADCAHQIPFLKCKDGAVISVQASRTHYCKPRDNEGPWTEFEVGFCTYDPILKPYAENRDDPASSDIFAYVPEEVVLDYFKRHGGVVGFASR